MKSRFTLLALAMLALSASAFAQGHALDPGSGVGPLHIPGAGGSTITARAYTAAILTDANGTAIGKVKTATIVTTNRGTLEGLRVTARSLTPGASYALVIDGTLVGTATADANGAVTFKFLSPSNGRTPAIPDAIRPIATAHTVQLYEASSQRLAASGTLSSGSPK